MNFNKFLEACKKVGISECELVTTKENTISFSLFHKELDNYSISNQSVTKARGVYKGKLGVSTTEKDGKEAIDNIVKSIIDCASQIEKEETPIIYKGSKKYYKKNVFNKELQGISVDIKLKKLHEVEDAAYALDKRITEVQCSYEESESENVFYNSNGLKLKNKANYFYYSVEVVAKDGDEVKSGYDVFLDSDFSKFDPKVLAKKAVDNAIAKLHGTPVKSKAYKAVLNQKTVSSLLNALIGTHLSADNVQKHTSLFGGKVHTQILSKRLTVEEKPLNKNCFFSYFDDEGVACTNKKIIDKGVLTTYLYNLETAKKDHVESTGDGRSQGGKIVVAPSSLVIKPGHLTEEELISKVHDGVYISSITGLHAGLNPQSGDFSLEAEGFHIENGKKTGPLTLITVSSNLVSVFTNIIGIANNSELELNTTTAPSIAIKGLKVSAS